MEVQRAGGSVSGSRVTNDSVYDRAPTACSVEQ